MTLIVEDGSIVAGAESYCTVAFATTYHSNIGNAAWAALASDTVREQCLRKATAYMVQAYRKRWAGYRYNATTQVLDWPRAYCPLPDAIAGYGSFQAYVPINTVPIEIKNACADLALTAATSTLLADTTQQITKETIGPISTEYDVNSPQVTQYRSIDAMLKIYFNTGSSLEHRLVR